MQTSKQLKAENRKAVKAVAKAAKAEATAKAEAKAEAEAFVKAKADAAIDAALVTATTDAEIQAVIDADHSAKPATKQAKPATVPLRAPVYAAYRASIDIDRASVPVKPVSQFKPAELYASTAKNTSMRQARCFRYIANCAKLGTLKAGSTIPRFTIDADGTAICIENGCARDMLGTGLVTFKSTGDGSTPDTTLTLTEAGFVHLRNNALLG